MACCVDCMTPWSLPNMECNAMIPPLFLGETKKSSKWRIPRPSEDSNQPNMSQVINFPFRCCYRSYAVKKKAPNAHYIAISHKSNLN